MTEQKSEVLGLSLHQLDLSDIVNRDKSIAASTVKLSLGQPQQLGKTGRLTWYVQFLKFSV